MKYKYSDEAIKNIQKKYLYGFPQQMSSKWHIESTRIVEEESDPST